MGDLFISNFLYALSYVTYFFCELQVFIKGIIILRQNSSPICQ
jgi:hypothetical protein